MISTDQTYSSFNDAARAYRELGVIMLRDFLSQDAVAKLSVEADRLLELRKSGKIEADRIADRPNIEGGRSFERFDPVCDIAPVFEEISHAPRILDLVKRVIGDEPTLLKDKLVYKLPGDRGYRVHQDYPYYHSTEIAEEDIATVAIAIDEVSSENGGLEFFLDCHHQIQPAPPDEPRDVDPAALTDAAKWAAKAPQGSLILFHALTPHASGPNISRSTRRLLYLTYIRKASSYLRETYYLRRAADRQAAGD